jgi:signal transduction histidine kinase
MRSASFRTKLLAATAAPLVVLLPFTYLLVNPRLEEAATAKENQVSAQHASLLASLSAAVQDERDRSAWFVAVATRAAGSPVVETELVRRREQLDQAREATRVAYAPLSEFEQTLPPAQRWAAGTMEGAVSDLETPRVLVDGDAPDIERIIERYNTRIESIQAVTRALASQSSNPELSRAATGLNELANHRGSLSSLRLAALSKLASNSFGPRDLGVVDSLRSVSDSSLKAFYETLSEQDRAATATRLSTPRSQAQETLDKLVAEVANGKPVSVDADTWWRDQDPRLNEVTLLESEQVAAFGKLAGEVAGNSRRSALSFAGAAAAAVVASALVGLMLARSLGRRLTDMARQARHIATEELPEVLKGLRNPTAEAVTGALPTVKTTSNDELAMMADAFNNVLHTSVRTSLEHSHQRAQTVTAMLVNLGRRNQSLIDRQLKIMDRLEAKEEDPDVLEALYEVDHLVTRMRRNAENLLVLSGQKQARTWSKPVSLYDVLRSAAAEVSDLNRVVIAEVPQLLTMSGPFAVDACHLLAELVENATRYSPKTSLVTLNTVVQEGHVTVTIVDSGVGMNDKELVDANTRLAHPPEIDELVADRVGFQVVGRLARKVGTVVTLAANPMGGTISDVSMPFSMFIENGALPADRVAPAGQTSQPASEGRAPLQTRPKLQSVPTGDSETPAVGFGLGSKKVALRVQTEEIWKDQPAPESITAQSADPTPGHYENVAPLMTRSTPATLAAAAPIDKIRVNEAAVLDVERHLHIPENTPAAAATVEVADTDQLPQRSRRDAEPTEVPQFFGGAGSPRPGGRSNAFAAVTQAKRAAQDHASRLDTDASPVPYIEPSPAPVAERPAAAVVDTPATSSVPGGLAQRRPGKVFSGAADAADAGKFRRLGDGSTEEVNPASRFNSLSKLQRGVSSARSFDETPDTVDSQYGLDPSDSHSFSTSSTHTEQPR